MAIASKCSWTLWAALCVLIVSGTARADKATAESLFQEGKRLMEQGQIEEACPKFQASMDAEPSVGAMLNLARCHELTGKTATAWAEYTEAANLARRAGQDEREKGALKHASELEPRLSRLTIRVSEPVEDLVVTRGEETIPSGSFGVAVPVDPGTHTIAARAPGKQSWTKSVVVGTDGDVQIVTIPELRDAAETSEPLTMASEGDEGPHAMEIAGIAAMSVGVVGLALGIGFGAAALVDRGDLDERCTHDGVLDRVNCPGVPEPELTQEVSDIRTKAHVSTAGFVVAGVGLVSGVILVVLTPRGEAATAVLPSVGPSGAGLTVSGRF